MSVYRARSSCPVCNDPHEVWFSKGKIEPLDIVECEKCSHMFEPIKFVSSFLEMRNNSTISISTSM